jgi:hypothetical protein
VIHYASPRTRRYRVRFFSRQPEGSSAKNTGRREACISSAIQWDAAEGAD